MVTEFGFDANRDGPVEVRGTYAFQANAIAYHLGVFATKPWLSGAMYFTLQDFAASRSTTAATRWHRRRSYQRACSTSHGNPKPAFAVVSQIYRLDRPDRPA